MKTSYQDGIKDGGEGPNQELVMLIGVNHLHQHDSYLLDPLLAFLKSGVAPHFNVGDVYLLNTQCLLKFLHRCDLHNDTFDVKVVDRNIAKLKDQYIAYIHKSPNIADDEDEIEREIDDQEGGS